MDSRENRIILVFQVSTSPATRRIGWIKGQFGKEPLAGSIGCCNLPQLRNVCGTQWRVIINSVEVRGVPFLHQLEFRGPRRLALAQLLEQHGISEATLYNWKSKYGGLDVSEVKRLRMLEDENRKLKKLLAESMLDNAALKELLAKKW